MTDTVAITIEQLSRPHRGGIGTYIVGLRQGLVELAGTDRWGGRCVMVGPRPSDESLPVVAGDGRGAPELRETWLGGRALTQLWRWTSVGIPRDADVVHATTMAGPFRGGRPDAVHSVLVHDLLWRHHPGLTTARGRAFHEQRLRQIVRTPAERVLVTSAPMADELAAAGVARERLHVVRLGVELRTSGADPMEVLRRHHLPVDGGGFTLAVGTIQPRKNLERLIEAHRAARETAPALGPIVLVGAAGWGHVDTADATVLGPLSDVEVGDLVAASRVCAYVPVAEGWGFPAVEALAAGRPLVAASSVPSVAGNPQAIVVDPLDVGAIADGLVRAAGAADDADARTRRRASVAGLSWANCALDHLAAWT